MHDQTFSQRFALSLPEDDENSDGETGKLDFELEKLGIFAAGRQDARVLGVPDVGRILKRLRLERGMSLREVAEASDLSISFLSSLERGECDIALSRLTRLAQVFNHDVGSLLRFTARRAQLQYVRRQHRVQVDRGEGVRYEVIRIPGVTMELILVDFEPESAFRDELTHEGVDVLLVTRGEIVVRVNGVEYVVPEGDCAVWSAGYPHMLRNATARPASAIAMVTETIY
jgi:transcriptional regulator with XRE-family HTH domain